MNRTLGVIAVFFLGVVSTLSALSLLVAGFTYVGALVYDALNSALEAAGQDADALDPRLVRGAIAFSLAAPLMFLGHVRVSETAAHYRDVGSFVEAMVDVPDSSLIVASAYLAAVIALMILITSATRRFDKVAINARVIARLRQADASYISRILGIADFDRTRMGSDDSGARFVDDALRLEATGGRGDAQVSSRDDAQLTDAVIAETTSRSWFQRLLPIYGRYERPTASGVVRLAARAALTTIFLGLALAAILVDTGIWYVSLVVALAAAFLLLREDQRWAHLLIQPAANPWYSWVTIAASGITATVGSWFIGNHAAAMYFAFFLMIALVFLSQAVVYELRKNGDADTQLARFFTTLIEKDVHGTHSFAQCASCDMVTVLVLGQAHPCDACHAPVDRSMNVRTVDV